MKNEERDERKSRKVLVPLATLAVAAAVAVGSGATWTSTTTSRVDVTAGKIIHTNSSTGAAVLKVTGLVPGKTAIGTLSIMNTGTADAVLKMTRTAASNALGSDLKLTIAETDQSTGTPAWTGLARGDFPTGGDTAVTLDDVFTQGEWHEYTFTVELVSLAADADQGKSASATFEFDTTPADSGPTVAGWNL